MRVLMLLGLLYASVAVWADDSPPVARVNEVPISQFRLERYFADYLQAQGRALTSIRSPSLYKRLREQALDELIDKELLWQEAQRRGIEVSDTAVARHIDQLRQAFGSADVFARRLAEAGFDEPGFARYTRHELVAQQAFMQLSQVAEPDEVQVRAFQQTLLADANPGSSSAVQGEQGLAVAKQLLHEYQQTEARQALLKRLRDKAAVERLEPR